MLTDEEIVKQLKQKEYYLMQQLEKVRIALSVYTDSGIKAYQPVYNQNPVEEPVTNNYDQNLSLDQKVIFALRRINSGYIDDIVKAIIDAGDNNERDRLFKGLTGSASKLLGKNILKADKRGRKYKYYLNPDTEKERAEILPLDS